MGFWVFCSTIAEGKLFGRQGRSADRLVGWLLLLLLLAILSFAVIGLVSITSVIYF
jgi:hypothetical protein